MDHSSHHAMVDGEHSPKEIIKFAGLIVAISAASWGLTGIYGPATLQSFLRWFMGVFFVTFASFKLFGYTMFPEMFAGYDVIAKRFKPYAYAYPFIELALGIAYLVNLYPFSRDVIALVVMAVSSIGVAQEIKKRSGIHCACLGNIIKLPLSTVSLVEDLGMGLMAIVMILAR